MFYLQRQHSKTHKHEYHKSQKLKKPKNIKSYIQSFLKENIIFSKWTELQKRNEQIQKTIMENMLISNLRSNVF